MTLYGQKKKIEEIKISRETDGMVDEVLYISQRKSEADPPTCQPATAAREEQCSASGLLALPK